MSLKTAEEEEREAQEEYLERVHGLCPECRRPLISSAYYVEGRGYLIVWECEGKLSPTPTCSYFRNL